LKRKIFSAHESNRLKLSSHLLEKAFQTKKLKKKENQSDENKIISLDNIAMLDFPSGASSGKSKNR
jgi:hypothetical protein